MICVPCVVGCAIQSQASSAYQFSSNFVNCLGAASLALAQKSAHIPTKCAMQCKAFDPKVYQISACMLITN